MNNFNYRGVGHDRVLQDVYNKVETLKPELRAYIENFIANQNKLHDVLFSSDSIETGTELAIAISCYDPVFSISNNEGERVIFGNLQEAILEAFENGVTPIEKTPEFSTYKELSVLPLDVVLSTYYSVEDAKLKAERIKTSKRRLLELSKKWIAVNKPFLVAENSVIYSGIIEGYIKNVPENMRNELKTYTSELKELLEFGEHVLEYVVRLTGGKLTKFIRNGYHELYIVEDEKQRYIL